eukprot:SAG11_NODE_64_length_18817_cov_64.238327_16_plen_109_part_00
MEEFSRFWASECAPPKPAAVEAAHWVFERTVDLIVTFIRAGQVRRALPPDATCRRRYLLLPSCFTNCSESLGRPKDHKVRTRHVREHLEEMGARHLCAALHSKYNRSV